MKRSTPESFVVWDDTNRIVVVGGYDARSRTYWWRCDDCDDHGELYPVLAQAMEDAAVHLATATSGPAVRA